MSRIGDVAREAGLNPVTCAHCGKATATDFALETFFRKILEHVKAGEAVHIKNFGVFRQQKLKGRKLKTPLVEVTEFEDSIVIRFKQSANAKAFLNEEDDGKAKGKGK
jgi:nucleoid DNA-binding protein